MNQANIVAYVNGEIVPASEAKISIFDHGFILADAAYDTERTFNGKIFKLEEHIDRLFDTCRYLDLDPGLTEQDLIEITTDVVEKNVPLLGPNEDYWVSQRLTRGVDRAGFPDGPTIIVECTPLPLAARAPYYRDGIPVVIPSVRRVPPWSISPRAKTHNYLNIMLGALEVQGSGPGSWAILLDENGNLAEGLGSNVFVVRDGALLTPRERYVLPAIRARARDP